MKLSGLHGWILIAIGLLIISGIVILPAFYYGPRMAIAMAPIGAIGLLPLIPGVLVLLWAPRSSRDPNIQKVNPYCDITLAMTWKDFAIAVVGVAATILAYVLFFLGSEYYPEYQTAFMWIGVLIIGATIIGEVLYFMWSRKNQRGQRETEAEQLATQLGGKFERRSGIHIDIKTPSMEKGSKRRAHCAVSWDCKGVPVTVFDFVVTHRTRDSDGRRSENTFASTVAAVRVENPVHFQLAPQGVWENFSQLFGGTDIDFVDDPEFSKSTILKGDNDIMVNEMFGAGARQHIVQHPGWIVEADHNHLIVYHDIQLYKVAAFPIFAEQVVELKELLNI